MLTRIALILIARAERKLGVPLDYTRQIAKTDIGLLARYNKIFGFLDPNRNLPPIAYHTARLIGARSADCGTCVEAEINLARQAGLTDRDIAAIVFEKRDQLATEVLAIIDLAVAVTQSHSDDSEARQKIRQAYGEAGLIELCFAMNGAALLPGIKRGMGYATACDLNAFSGLPRD